MELNQEIHYNQNEVTEFVPLFQHTQSGEKRDVIMMAQGQEQGVLLCDLGKEFVTWKIYRHDRWRYTNHGNYHPYEDDKAEAFEKAKADFLDRLESI